MYIEIIWLFQQTNLVCDVTHTIYAFFVYKQDEFEK